MDRNNDSLLKIGVYTNYRKGKCQILAPSSVQRKKDYTITTYALEESTYTYTVFIAVKDSSSTEEEVVVEWLRDGKPAAKKSVRVALEERRREAAFNLTDRDREEAAEERGGDIDGEGEDTLTLYTSPGAEVALLPQNTAYKRLVTTADAARERVPARRDAVLRRSTTAGSIRRRL